MAYNVTYLYSLKRVYWWVGWTSNWSHKQTNETFMWKLRLDWASSLVLPTSRRRVECVQAISAAESTEQNYIDIQSIYWLPETEKSPNLFSTRTEYVQTCFHRKYEPSCQYGVKHPTLNHSNYDTGIKISKRLSVLLTLLTLLTLCCQVQFP